MGGDQPDGRSRWTLSELYEELAHYEKRLLADGMSSDAVSAEVDTAERFLRRLDMIRLP